MEFNEIEVLRLQVQILANKLTDLELENSKLTAMLQIKASEKPADHE